MKDVEDSLNTSFLSQSYTQGMRRLAGDPNRNEDTFQISRKIIENREKSWSILFDKFSEISDDLELNLRTLRPDTSSNQSEESEPDVSKPRVPIRKSMAQLQHWINTGKAPCQLMEVEESCMDDIVSSLDQSISIESSDSNATVSISESEMLDPNLLDPHSSFTMNRLEEVNNRKDSFDGSSDSSVDTTTYIKRNTNVMKKTVNLSNNGKVIQSGHSRESEVSRDKLLESPWSGMVSKDLLNGTVSIGKNCSRRIGDKNEELQSLVDKSVFRNVSNPDNNMSCNGAIGKRFESALHENSDDEFHSRHSDIILPMNNENLERSNATADPLNDASLVAKDCLHGRRKLYTKDTCLTDVKLSECHTNSRRSRSIQIKHPALLTPVSMKKSQFKPRLLTTQRCPRGKKSRNFSLNLIATRTRGGTKPVLLENKSLENSTELPERTPGGLYFTGTPKVKISEVPKSCSNKCVVIDSKIISKMTNVNTQLDQIVPKSPTSPGGQKIGTSLSSASIDSNGVSSIIDDEIPEGLKNQVTAIPVNMLPKQSASLDVSMFGDKELRNDCRNSLSSDHQASICESLPKSSYELTGARMQNFLRAKRNLNTTDLQSCGNLSTLSVVSSANSNKSNISDNGGLSMTRQPNFESHNTSKTLSRSNRVDYSINSVQLSAQFQPIVILHDFLYLRSCCGELERENNKQWLNRQGNVANSNPSTVDFNRQAQERESSSGHSVNGENIILQSSHIQTSVEKKLKMDDKLRKRAEVNITRCNTINDNKKKEMTSLCEITAAENVKNTTLGSTPDTILQAFSQTLKTSFTAGINHIQKTEPPIKMHTSSVTFTDTSCNWESIFIPTSSDEEDAVIKLNRIRKSRTSNRKEAGIQQTNGARLNATEHVKDSTFQPASMLQSSMSVKKSLSIVSSCSEDEEKTAAGADMTTSSTRLQRKYSKRTRRRDILKSRLTICSPIDERTDKSESMLVNNEILESPSTDVITRLRKKKSKQSIELSTASFPSAQSKVDAETHSYKEPRIEVMQIPNDSEVGVSNKPNRTELCESYHAVTENELLKTPVHRTLKYSPNKSDDTSRINLRCEDATCSGPKITSPRCQSPKNLFDGSGISSRSTETKSSLRITRDCAKISLSSPDKTERKQEGTNGLVVGRVPDYKNKRKHKLESMTFRKHIPFVYKSSDDDDAAFTSNSKDYTCTDSPGEKVLPPNEKRNMVAISDASESSSKKDRRKTRTTSTVVFRTKEYWESDSDNM